MCHQPSRSFLGFIVGLLFFSASQAGHAQAPGDSFDRTNHRLLGDERIASALDQPPNRTEVIVLLEPTEEVANFSAWDVEAELQKHHERVQALQDRVLGTLADTDWELRYRFENQATFSGTIDAAGLGLLLEDSRVLAIEPVLVAEPLTKQGIALVDASGLRSQLSGGEGVAIAIADTGLDYDHPGLGDGGFPNNKVIGGRDVGDSDDDPMPLTASDAAHGTACAGIAAGFQTGPAGLIGDYVGGVADQARIYALKITDDPTTTSSNAAICMAWDWCVSNKNADPNAPILVISTSFGQGRFLTPCDFSPGEMALTMAAQNANSAGITIVVSSGNDGYCDAMQSPACISNVISVGAVYDAAVGQYGTCVQPQACSGVADPDCASLHGCLDSPTYADLVTCYSNSASFLDLLAPAQNAYTLDTLGSSGYSPNAYVHNFGGTSAACPYVAGVVALLQAAARRMTGSYLTPDQVRTFLTTSGDLVTDNRTGDTVPRVNAKKAVHALSAKWGFGGGTVNIMAQVFADNFDTSGADDPFPLGVADMRGTQSFVNGLLGSSIGAHASARARDKFYGYPETFVTSQATGMVLVDGVGTPELQLTWWTHTRNASDVEAGHFATALVNLNSMINLRIDPSPSNPPGTPVTVWVSWDQFGKNNSQAETTGNVFTGEGEDVANLLFTFVQLAGTELLTGRFDFPNPPYPPFSTQAYSLKDETAVLTGLAVGDQFPFQVGAANDSMTQLPGKLWPNPFGDPCYLLCDDIGNTAFYGRMRLSLVGPPGALPLPGASLGPPVPLDDGDFVFSLDIGSDTELSDPFGDGDEVFDPGDVLSVSSVPVPPGGPLPSLDDASIFGTDPWPNSSGGVGTAAPTCTNQIPSHLWFDLDGVDRLGVSVDSLLAAGVTPIPRFRSSCIHNGEFLIASFEDDGPSHYTTNTPPCDVPAASTAASGNTYGTTRSKDEVLAFTIARGPVPSAVTETFPLADERMIHPSLAPNPDNALDADDDLDALDYKDPGALCDYWYFSPDHEGVSTGLLDPGSIYEVTPAGPALVIDDALHLGLSEETDLDAFEFIWLFDPSFNEVLALSFSVDEDDPVTIEDESGGLDPSILYGSFLDGSSFELLLEPITEDREDIDGLTAVPVHPSASTPFYRYRADPLFLGYPPTGVSFAKLNLVVEEDSKGHGFPHDTLGFSMRLAHDPAWLTAVDVAPAPAIAALNAGAGPDYFAPQVAPNAISVDVIYDQSPGSPTVVEFSSPVEVVTVTYAGNAAALVATPSGGTTTLVWRDSLALPAPPNVITLVDGSVVVPHQVDIPVVMLPDYGQCFVRGDCTDDAQLDISDPVLLLDYLFGTGSLSCKSACDIDDDDQLDVGDVVGLLGFLFSGTGPLVAPFPMCGVDPGSNCQAFSSCPAVCP